MTAIAASRGDRQVRYTPQGRERTGGGPSLFSRRELVFQLLRRELARRYRGRFLGLFWLVLQPLLILALYTFVFGVVFGARWPGFESGQTLGFAMVVFTGLIAFSIFAEVAGTAPGLVQANAPLLKNVDFPAEVLPIVSVACALVQALASLVVLLVGGLALGQTIPASAAALPLVWLPLLLFALGTSYLLAAIGVFLRDLEAIVGLVVTGLLFGSAIFYPLSQVPEAAREWLAWLPTSVFVEATRQVLLYGQLSLGTPEWVVCIATLPFAVAAYRIFERSKGAFADVL